MIKNNKISCIVKKGSSETTREALLKIYQDSGFDFTAFVFNEMPDHKKEIDLIFLQWFIGFVEGDGCFCYKLEDGRPRFTFEISQKDPKILYKIKRILGFGQVRPSPKFFLTPPRIYYKYVVENKEGIRRLITLFNGNLVFNKRRLQFNEWVQKALIINSIKPNVRPILPNNFTLKESTITVSLNSAWLSGLIDGEGCFYAHFSEAKPSNRSKVSKIFKQKMHITQKSIESSYVLNSIRLLFKSTAKPYQIKKKPGNYRVEMSSLISDQEIRNYLERYPLQTLKLIAFYRWSRVLDARLRKEHLKEERIDYLTKICEAINKATYNYKYLN